MNQVQRTSLRVASRFSGFGGSTRAASRPANYLSSVSRPASHSSPWHSLATRNITTSSRLWEESTAQPSHSIQKDPSHPSLYYHLRPAPNAVSSVHPAFALSFLGKPLNKKYPSSRTIIGWLPAETPNAEEVGLGDFKQNAGFLDLLHETIQKTLEEPGADPIIEADAIQRVDGWLHIHDMRVVPALGRIGDPDDIIATVLVEGGKIQTGTYQRMPAYRLCTADGLPQLTEGLYKRLQQALAKELEMENKG